MTTRAMAAVAYDPTGNLAIQEIELDDLQPKEVLIDIEAVGICHTDSKFQKILPLPGVFGHEGTGYVLEVGSDVTEVKPGDRVIMAYPFCTNCMPCQDAEPYKCENIPALKFAGQRIDGTQTISLNGEKITSSFFQQSSFATKAITLEQSVVKVGTEPAPELLAGLACGVQTGAGVILNSFQVKADDPILIIGAGAVGLSAIMAAKYKGAGPIICIDINEERLKMATRFGATHIFNANQKSLKDDILNVAKKGVKFAFESSASVAGLKNAIDCIGQGGRIGIVSFPISGQEFPFTTKDLFLKVGTIESIVQGSSTPKIFLPKLMELQKKGFFPYEKLIKTYKFSEINKAIQDVRTGKVIKPVLLMK